MMRDPEIDTYAFLDEAVEALRALLPDGSALRSLIFLTLAVMLDHDGGKPPRQSHLNDLHETFAKAVDEAETAAPQQAG